MAMKCLLGTLVLSTACVTATPASSLAQEPAKPVDQEPAEAPAPPRPAPHRPARGPRGFLSANVGGLLTANDFTTSGSFPVYQENATFQTDYKVPSALALDIGGGVALWRNLGVAVAVTWDQPKGDASLTGSVPHPFFLNKPRSVSGTVPGLEHTDTAVHVNAAWIAPLNKKVLLVAFGGPSFFSVKQDLVTQFTFADTYPYDEASFSSATVSKVSKSAVGFNAGVDVTYFLTRKHNVGVGGVLRFTRASLTLPSTNLSNVSVDAGGAIVSGGVRWVF